MKEILLVECKKCGENVPYKAESCANCGNSLKPEWIIISQDAKTGKLSKFRVK